MYRIEMIPKKSTLDDVLDLWRQTGREYNEEGEFYFEDAADFTFLHGGFFSVEMPGGKSYFYNLNDFYRVKIIKTTQPELFDR